MNTAPIKLNIYDLYRDVNTKKEKKYNIYNDILYKIHDKIKKTASKERFKVLYDVPEFVFGLPSYNLNHCNAYLIKHLRNNGFLVKYYFPKILYISWDPQEIKEYKKNKKLVVDNYKDLQKKSNQLYNPNNFYVPKNNQGNQSNQHNYSSSNFSNSTNIDFKNQLELVAPQNTQESNGIFNPILQYNPNQIPTYNYYAYSSLNQNLVNDKFFINNRPEDFNKFKKTANDMPVPQHIQNLQIQDRIHKVKQESQKNAINENYQRDIMDYYNDEPSHPFPNTIKKMNTKGKFVLDLS